MNIKLNPNPQQQAINNTVQTLLQQEVIATIDPQQQQYPTPSFCVSKAGNNPNTERPCIDYRTNQQNAKAIKEEMQ